MGDQPGTFIVVEGADGSGKTTQLDLLQKQLVSHGYDVVLLDFPRYNEPSSYFVRQYLSGKYGNTDEVGPYTTSLFYALDRYAAADEIREALRAGKVVLVDRYVGSNMAHQGTKFRNVEERRGYFIWLDNLEFEMLGIPRPTMSFVLQVPSDTGLALLEKRATATGKPLDIHEKNLDHQRLVRIVFDDLCKLFPKDFVRVDEVRDNTLLEPEVIHSILWQKLVPLLPERPASVAADTPKSDAVTEPVADNPYLRRNTRGIYQPTAAGKAFLESVVTNSTGNVYSFTDKLGPMLIASALSQRTKRADDLRLLLMEEYADADGNSRAVIENSDAVSKRLTGLYAIAENASSLLTKKLERHNIASYLELSSPHTYLDQKDRDGNYAYYTPPELDPTTMKHYRAHMNQLFDGYAELVRSLTSYLQETSAVPVTRRNDAWQTKIRAEACQVAAAALPIATTTAVGVFASAEALETLVTHLLSDDLPEARTIGKQLLSELRTALPSFLDGANLESIEDSIGYQVSTREAIKTAVDSYAMQSHGGGNPAAVQLIAVSPRNELELLPDMLYEASNVSARELQSDIARWPYERKLEVFTSYLGERRSRQQVPGRALDKAHYTWELLTDYNSFRQLQGYLAADPEWQPLTPRYGFAMPKLITGADLEDQFEACFELSLKLYSLLQNKGYPVEAQYATLLGHKLRFKLTHNAREAFQLHEQPDRFGNPAYRQLVREMHEKLAEVHPTIGEAVKFVDHLQTTSEKR